MGSLGVAHRGYDPSYRLVEWEGAQLKNLTSYLGMKNTKCDAAHPREP